MTELIGSLGAVLLALCGLPELVRSYKRKRCDIGWGFLGSWLIGEALVLIYVVLTSIDFILLANYSANLVIILGLIYYKIRRQG
jgi:uncharacterized protein with PQ loop repeat